MKASDIELIVDPESTSVSVSLGDLLARTDGPHQASWLDLPDAPGVYAICLPDWKDRSLSTAPDPPCQARPADLDELLGKRRRILEGGPTDILYVGKASNLRRRIRQVVRFGRGLDSSHRGAERLWHLQGIDDAELRMWRCSRTRLEPLKRELLARFRRDHGEWPFAN